MGTNYYHRTDICEHCDRYSERHIGLSSGGWQFTFRGYNDVMPKILSFEDWKRELKNGKIFSGYGEEICFEEFVAFVEEKQTGTFNDKPNKNHYDYCKKEAGNRGYDMRGDWKDDEGYSFSNSDFS